MALQKIIEGMTGAESADLIYSNDEYLDQIKADLSEILEISDFNNIYSLTVSGNASGATTAFNNAPSNFSGILYEIKGRFFKAGQCDFVVADKNSNTSVTARRKFSVPIPAAGEQTIRVDHLKIPIVQGQVLGVDISSTAGPMYGTDASVGFGWLQTQQTMQIGVAQTVVLVATANFAMTFNTVDFNFIPDGMAYTKDETDVLLTDKVDVNEVFDDRVVHPINSANTSLAPNSSLGNDVPAPVSGYIGTLRFNAATTGSAKFQVFKRLTFNSSGVASGKDTFEAVGAPFIVPVTGTGTADRAPASPTYIDKDNFVIWLADDGLVNPRFGMPLVGAPYGWWQGGKNSQGTVQLTYQPQNVTFQYEVRGDIFMRNTGGPAPEPQTQIIIASRNAANFNSIRDIIKGITDASAAKPYLIIVPAGDWFEIDHKGGGPYITVMGMGINDTRLLIVPVMNKYTFSHNCLRVSFKDATTQRYILPAVYTYTYAVITICALAPYTVKINILISRVI